MLFEFGPQFSKIVIVFQVPVLLSTLCITWKNIKNSKCKLMQTHIIIRSYFVIPEIFLLLPVILLCSRLFHIAVLKHTISSCISLVQKE